MAVARSESGFGPSSTPTGVPGEDGRHLRTSWGNGVAHTVAKGEVGGVGRICEAAGDK